MQHFKEKRNSKLVLRNCAMAIIDQKWSQRKSHTHTQTHTENLEKGGKNREELQEIFFYLFLIIKYLVSFWWGLIVYEQHASSPFPCFIFLSCFVCKTRFCSLLESSGGKKEIQENKSEGGRPCCSWNHLGDPSILLSLWHGECVFPFFLSVLHAMCVLCTHALFIVAFINNLIERQGKESHLNITGPNGTESPINMGCKCSLQQMGETEREREES